MGFNNIEKKDWFYKQFYNYTQLIHNKLFYRNVFVLNEDKVPKKGHLIYTLNHQNALMDALAPLFNIKRQLVFLARSDIFQKKAVANILYFLKILPVFRIRDGYSSVKKNTKIFQKTIDVINAQNGLVILPEGNHEGVLYLRPFKKGFARIAFQSEEANNFSLDTKIVPMGIHYSNYIKSRSDLYINFGDPISVSDYYALYKEFPAKAINKLTSDLAEHIKPLIVSIDRKHDYELYDSIRQLYWEQMCDEKGNKKCSRIDRIKAEQTAISLTEQLEDQNPERFKKLKNLNEEYNSIIQNTSITSKLLSKPFNLISVLLQAIGLIITLPLFLFGLLMNLFPFAIVKYLEKRIKDPQFKSSVKFVLSIFIFPIFYLIQSLLFFILSPSFWIGLCLTISLPLSGIFAYYYFSCFTNLRMKWKVWLFKSKRKSKYKNAINIKEQMDQLIASQKINFFGKIK